MTDRHEGIPPLSGDPTFHFGAYVFNDRQMRTRLSKDTYSSLMATIRAGKQLDLNIAGEVAAAMKQWALELGATHYTHWFMPMNGTTAEKQDSFLEHLGDGRVMMDFSAKALIKGEPDASSFPSGGLRETAKARGYTAWDCTSPAFVKQGTLYIPTAFFSHTGEILDKKSPLLRSVEVLNQTALELMRAVGRTDIQRVQATVGPEQEYFLVDRKQYEQRPDLVATGRTLFGARPPKGQELEDQYLGTLRPAVKAFMDELNQELWRFGVAAKSQHNEVAPTQHELTVIFDPASVASDNNMLTMDCMRRLAWKHGMACLLHEKPYRGVNGSGKHINWSLSTETGENLLLPGEDPAHNLPFLAILAAIIQAIDVYGDVLAVSVASAANDHRLGGGEAPPAILSMFLGEDLEALLEALEEGTEEYRPQCSGTNLGINSLSYCTVDATDRNRTSPFAFTGNRFEFRMVGSTANVAGPVFSLNAIVAHAFRSVAEEITESGLPPKEAVYAVVRRVLREHRRVLFNGDNYSKEWPIEAAKRGLYKLNNAVEAFEILLQEKNLQLFEETGVLNRKEAVSRYHILADNYAKQVGVEARTALYMVRRQILPAAWSVAQEWADTISGCEAVGLRQSALRARLEEVHSYCEVLAEEEERLRGLLRELDETKETPEAAKLCCDQILPSMEKLRESADRLETLLPANRWPFPTYTDLFYHFED